MSRLNSPESPRYADQDPQLDPTNPAYSIASQLLEEQQDPLNPEVIREVIDEAERICAEIEKAEIEAREIEAVTTYLKESAKLRGKYNRDKAFLNNWDHKDYFRKDVIKKHPVGSNHEERATDVLSMVKTMREKLPELKSQAREAFQKAYFNGETLEEVEAACGEQDDINGLIYWRPEVQKLYEIFINNIKEHRGKSFSDNQCEEWVVYLMQRRKEMEARLLLTQEE